ncbi:MAG: App1 family protein [Prolixibacteraceae bacterium]
MTTLKKITHNAEKSFDKAKLKVKNKLHLFDPVIIYPYRGYANGYKAQIHGRILEKERMIHEEQVAEDTLWNNVRKIWKRYESDEIPGVALEGEFFGIKSKTRSDEEGYFTLVFEGLEKEELADGWHKAKIRITDMPFDVEYEETAIGEILNSSQQNEFGIISDVDDTIIKSHAMNLIKKLRILITKNVKNRVAFEGVDELYRKLIAKGKNPLFFISGSSYNLYDMLVKFCELQDIPDAPFVLRDLGLDARQWIKMGTMKYKKQHIHHLLEFYDQLPFIFIGDSGQKDPEIYLDIYQNHPERVKAIYIRHVHTDKRKKELEDMIKSTDVPFLVMSHSRDAVQHAAENNWIE